MRSFSLNLGSDFKNVPIGLKLDINDPNNFFKRLNFQGHPRSKDN